MTRDELKGASEIEQRQAEQLRGLKAMQHDRMQRLSIQNYTYVHFAPEDIVWSTIHDEEAQAIERAKRS